MQLIRLIVACLLACFLQAEGADKYTDENRPYEFGFSIDGEQHRHEKKDENGIIMGEFGFITADGVYHVTVYATDENGNFKILSMKNIRVKPYPNASAKKGHSLPFPPSDPKNPPPPIQAAKPSKVPLPAPAPASSIKSCSGCLIPIPTTTASPSKIPQPASVNSPQQFASSPNQRTPNTDQNYAQSPNVNLRSNFPQNEDSSNYPQQPSVLTSPANNNYPKRPSSVLSTPQIANSPQSPSFAPSLPVNANYPQQQASPQSSQQNTDYPQNIVPQSTPDASIPGNNGQIPVGNSEQYPSGNQTPSYPERNPKQYDLNNYPQPSNSPSTPKSIKPTLQSVRMQIVDKDTDIYHKEPGEKDGLPEGLSIDDMHKILYTFNYTVGFHGHFEEGYQNGAKKGYYYVTGRNGVRTRVDYEADENGFRPKITQEVLDLLSDEVPKPETEKDEKYGLKSYEFKWLYFPEEKKTR